MSRPNPRSSRSREAQRGRESLPEEEDIAFAHTELGDPPALHTELGDPPALHTELGDPPALHTAETLAAPPELDPRLLDDLAGRAEAASRTLPDRATVLPRDGVGDVPLQGGGSPRFGVVRKLGEGGMGEVTLVFDNDIGRTVAMKRLAASAKSRPEALLRFAREVRTVGRLEHPNIVPVHDVGLASDGSHYFVMKHVEGETVESIINQLVAGDPAYHRRFTHEYRTQIFMEILRAIHHAHTQGIIHRDIKPANVMVGPYGEVAVLDWGIAKELRRADEPALPEDAPKALEGGDPRQLYLTRRDGLLGTPAYMAPEQARGEVDKVDQRSDIYSLCVLFHHFLALRHYQEDKARLAELLHAIGHEPDLRFFTWATGLRAAGVPPELTHFLRRGMRKDPAHRYQSVAEMMEALDRVRDHRVEILCHLTFIKRCMGTALHALNKYPFGAFVVVLASLVLAFIGFVSVVRQFL